MPIREIQNESSSDNKDQLSISDDLSSESANDNVVESLNQYEEEKVAMDPNGEDHKPSLNNENESPSKNNEAKCVEVQVFNKLCDEVIKLGVEILKKDSENDTFADDEKILEQKILEE